VLLTRPKQRIHPSMRNQSVKPVRKLGHRKAWHLDPCVGGHGSRLRDCGPGFKVRRGLNFVTVCRLRGKSDCGWIAWDTKRHARLHPSSPFTDTDCLLARGMRLQGGAHPLIYLVAARCRAWVTFVVGVRREFSIPRPLSEPLSFLRPIGQPLVPWTACNSPSDR